MPYYVNVTRGDQYWIVELPELRRATQARHLREVDAMARDLIAIMTDSDPDTVTLDVHITMPSGAQDHLDRAGKLFEEAKLAQSHAADEVRQAARLLRADGLPLRDIGQLLNVSYQRAGQLVS